MFILFYLHASSRISTVLIVSAHSSFGITPTMEKLYHKGLMRTKCEDCQFVCITQQDYYRILHQGEENTVRHEEDGDVVLITEHRVLDSGNRNGHIVIKVRLRSFLVSEPPSDLTLHWISKANNILSLLFLQGSPERLMSQLVEENSVIDPSYVEDFLLTHRTFITNPNDVAKKLLSWFEDSVFRDRVSSILSLNESSNNGLGDQNCLLKCPIELLI